jgi:uroporphyrinogen-III synthase
MSLLNKRIVITRARHQAGELVDMVRRHGAIPVLYPCIAIIPPADTAPLDDALAQLSTSDWLLITSTNTVAVIHQRLIERQLSPDWNAVKMGAIGKSTAKAIHNWLGCEADFIPSQASAQHLASELPLMRGERVLLPQSALAKPTIADIITDRGGIVTAITAYQTIADDGGEDVPQLLRQNAIHAVTFTSPSSVREFVARVGYIPDVRVGCIGDTTAQTARDMGFVRVSVAKDACLADLLDKLSAI